MITMACSVSGLGTVDNGGTEMGPAVVGFSGADRLFLFRMQLVENIRSGLVNCLI